MQPPAAARPVLLHVIHDLGGGAAKWLAELAAADPAREHLVLKSISHASPAGGGLALFDARTPQEPLAAWTFREPIAAVAVAHAEHADALQAVIARHGVAGVIISSLIGHSLDALRTGLPTLHVCHDYFPFCAGIHLWADGSEGEDAFAGFDAAARHAVREAFVTALQQPQVTLVAPSRSVVDNLRRLDARFAGVRMEVVPHGHGARVARVPPRAGGEGERLRVMVLGQLSTAKGAALLRAALPALTAFADVHCVGAGALGEQFAGIPGVHVISRYAPGELATVVGHVDPHVGLLASVVAETFGYTLSELFMMGIPVAATRSGAYAERVHDGVDGWLFEPHVAALVACLRRLDLDRGLIAAARAALVGWEPRSAAAMAADYARLLPVAPRAPRPATALAGPVDPGAALAGQTVTLASMWAEMKSLHLQLSIAREGWALEGRRAVAERERLQAAAKHAEARAQSLAAIVQEKDRHIAGLAHQLRLQEAQMRAIFQSMSWRALGPWRRARRGLARVALLARCLRGVAIEPPGASANLRQVLSGWRHGGVLGFKTALLAFASTDGPDAAWREYRAALQREVLPQLAAQVARLAARPRISIVMATYDTAPTMLRAALDSIRAQAYPEWELCVADDASPSAHVGAILREYAGRDPRIRIAWGESNQGVAHASNRALALATGEFVVLMDHDDVLEEQALLRFAQAIVEDRPDLAYSDELLVTADAARATALVHRPAFSPELLRGHPYIVHLVGFRTQLLRDIGGFDESLRISQDYDLILRASERARRVVHIPEVLYRWRTHARSAGHQLMDRVMETSTAILQRHLDRAAPGARVQPGFGFNFFDVRYPLQPGARVAVIIPTRDHGDLARQCVESLAATVRDVAMDIVVVDHLSRDPETLAWMAASPHLARVIRYEGEFNFSAINNAAVAQLGGAYTHYLFCNNDIEALQPGWLERMVAQAQQPGVGIVGAQLLYGDRKTIQHAGVGVGLMVRAEHYGKFVRMPDDRVEPGYYGSFHVSRDVSAVTAACMLMRAEAFAEVGGFDEAIAVGFGDVDLCLRARERGWRVVQCAPAVLVHHESQTRGPNDPHPADTALFEARYKRVLAAGDPFYNPGLSTSSTTWALQRPLPVSPEVRRRVAQVDPATGRLAIEVVGG